MINFPNRPRIGRMRRIKTDFYDAQKDPLLSVKSVQSVAYFLFYNPYPPITRNSLPLGGPPMRGMAWAIKARTPSGLNQGRSTG